MTKLASFVFLLLLAGCVQKQSNQKSTKNIKNVQSINNKKEKRKAPMGLKTKILRKAPKGADGPEIGHTVTVHYTGWISNEDKTPGRQIDSSIERGKPLEFTIGLNQVIKGFEEGALLMKIGEKRRLFIDPELGYGKRGVGLFIPPDSALIFDVELLKVR